MRYVDSPSRNHILVLEGCSISQTLSIKQITDLGIKKIAEDLRTLKIANTPLYKLRSIVNRKSKVIVIRASHDMGHIDVDCIL